MSISYCLQIYLCIKINQSKNLSQTHFDEKMSLNSYNIYIYWFFSWSFAHIVGKSMPTIHSKSHEMNIDMWGFLYFITI